MGLIIGVGNSKPTFPCDYYYGIEWDSNVANSACTRIGRTELHQTLPIQSRMRRCLLADDGTVTTYLHATDSTKTDTGATANLTGASGQVMVEIPAHYRKFEVEGTKYRCLISEHALPGFHFVPLAYRSAYEATTDRTTESIKLASVVNLTAAFRGGNNNADWDGTYRTLLGRPASFISLTDFRAYARNRGEAGKNGKGWNCDVYEVQKTCYWLYAIEYANFNSQATYNAEPDANGYKQGGLGDGVTTLNSTFWSSYNNYYPFIPCGHTNNLGNRTGVIDFAMLDEYGTGNYTAGTTGGTVSGGGSVNHGGSVTVTASAAAGYQFDGWYSAGATGGSLLSSSASYAISGVTASMTVYARFTKKYYTIIYSAGDYFASLSRTSERVAHGANAAGSTMTVPATTAQYSYGVDGWYNGATKITSSATYAPTDVTANATYTAKGTRSLRSYTVTYNKNAYIASVSRASESVSYGGTAAGSTASLPATTAQYSYSFDGWYNGSTRVSTSVTYSPGTITGNVTVEARGNRTTRSYTISVSLDSSAAGRGSVSGGGSYNYGASATVVCTKTNSADVFDGWYEGGTRVSTSLSYQFTVTGARTLVAKILYL